VSWQNQAAIAATFRIWALWSPDALDLDVPDEKGRLLQSQYCTMHVTLFPAELKVTRSN
jgi:hypothetical protein